ncbi:Hypothetical predicted protein [Podarcis lilfordi]|uniref:Uncharacterized protein n=1 Tax=Podarcis lilfordi TaxID=74358 RepID=A0AA35PCD0_9SAUR|nr:Hypothetical predicted protein [Podarcis lilfordi]
MKEREEVFWEGTCGARQSGERESRFGKRDSGGLEAPAAAAAAMSDSDMIPRFL